MDKGDGRDSLGIFDLTTYSPCGVCGEKKGRRLIVVIYRDKPRVSPYVKEARSLLIKNIGTGKFIRTIGINCGCYAKVHRQVAYIESSESTGRVAKASKKGRGSKRGERSW